MAIEYNNGNRKFIPVNIRIVMTGRLVVQTITNLLNI